HAGRQVEVHQRVHRLRRSLEDVDEALVRTHLEVLARLLVDVRGPVDAEPVDLRGERHRTAHERAGALRRVDDALGRLIEHAVIVRFESDTNLLLSHVCLSRESAQRVERSVRGEAPRDEVVYGPRVPRQRSRWPDDQSATVVTTPAPTVRPPSRIAKRRPSSHAIGVISSTSIWTLSPGITISTPSGSLIVPVTSVVRK